MEQIYTVRKITFTTWPNRFRYHDYDYGDDEVEFTRVRIATLGSVPMRRDGQP